MDATIGDDLQLNPALPGHAIQLPQPLLMETARILEEGHEIGAANLAGAVPAGPDPNALFLARNLGAWIGDVLLVDEIDEEGDGVPLEDLDEVLLVSPQM